MKEAQYGGAGAVRKDHVVVAVRLRPMSEREYARGDREVWECEGQKVGIVDDETGRKTASFAYDHVFPGVTGNSEVYESVAEPIVSSTLDGINGTVFAYGVTSSGKTHTMMGTEAEPGLVPLAIRQLFATMGRQSSRMEYTLRLSMMEIYNEVLNDLLNTTGVDLALQEDRESGAVIVKNISEVAVVSAEHTLQVIARGSDNRKVAATAFNEGSSRSHTIIRLRIEARERPGGDADPSFRARTTFSQLNLIDLAGSESAKAEIHKSQRREGAFINKSLLTLGTVIHKLADGEAAHVPYRDSKLTRLLKSRRGAKIAVVCTITPASTQAEETHNTLKFASRAKRITVAVQRNENVDKDTRIKRYEQENARLRALVDMMARERGGLPLYDPMSPEVRALQERLEEEAAALAAREAALDALRERMAGLVRCVLDGVAASTQLEARFLAERAAQLGEDFGADAGGAAATSGSSAGESNGGDDAGNDGTAGFKAANGGVIAGSGPGADSTARPQSPASPLDLAVATGPGGATPAAAALEVMLRNVTAAGDLIPAIAAVDAAGRTRGRAVAAAGDAAARETALLRQQVAVLAGELAQREALLSSVKNLGASGRAPPAGEDDVTMEILLADREFLQAQLAAADDHSDKLARALERMRLTLAEARGVDPDTIGYGLEAAIEEDSPEIAGAARTLRHGYDHVLAEKVLAMESKVGAAIDALRAKEEQIHHQRTVLSSLAGLEDQIQGKLAEMSGENSLLRNENGSLRREMERLEAFSNYVQGYNLDYLSAAELSELIGTLTQAVERVRITVQLRRLARGTRGSISASFVSDGSAATGMTREAMKAALEELRMHSPTASLNSTGATLTGGV